MLALSLKSQVRHLPRAFGSSAQDYEYTQPLPGGAQNERAELVEKRQYEYSAGIIPRFSVHAQFIHAGGVKARNQIIRRQRP